MEAFQQLFQLYISEINTLLTLAQSSGRIENYELEVIFSTPKNVTIEENTYDESFLRALLNILQIVQKMINEVSKPKAMLPHEENLTPQIERLCEQQHHGNDINPQAQLPQNCPRLDYIDHRDKVSHCKSPNKSCIAPQHPTTKEAEAANVLMNLSGKAPERVGLIGLEPCTRPKVLCGFENKPLVFVTTTAPTISREVYLEGKKEQLVCDEVPQINEKDLLPLATQVLCQFCSKQCEDLVELHEHVLAVHNIPDSELPVMPSVKRFRSSCSSEMEEAEISGHLPDSDKQKEIVSHNLGSTPITVETSTLAENDILTLKLNDSMKQWASEKEAVDCGKCMSTSKFVNVCEQGDSLTHINVKNDYKDKDGISIKAAKGRDCVVPLSGGGVGKHELDPSHSRQLQLQLGTVTSESKNRDHCQGATKSKNNFKDCLASTASNPVIGDPLAIAIESSQIKVIEAKVIIFVCLKCSWCYTHSQEYKYHKCYADRPFIKTCSDGSVVLVDNPVTPEDSEQFSNCKVWYFPEFLIRQASDITKGVLEIIYSTSGRKLQLCTSYQPSYLGEQFISFREITRHTSLCGGQFGLHIEYLDIQKSERCPICEKDSDSLNLFIEHLTKGPCMFRCTECSLVYKTQDKLQAHRATMHPKVEDRTCPNCHMVFEKRHQRNRHLKTQCSKNHICSICGRVLKNEYSLRVHMQSHKEREHVCKECGASFHRRTILLRHMMCHSGIRPHACNLCTARFFTRQHLNTHLDRHNGFKRYSCSECNKAYYSKHDRDNHFVKTHGKVSVGQRPTKGNKEELELETVVE